MKETFKHLPQKLCQLILYVLMTQSLIVQSFPSENPQVTSSDHQMSPSSHRLSSRNRERRQDSDRNKLIINQECPLNFIDCDNGRCVKFELINDGKDDCGNGKDESYDDCPANQFRCHNSTKCLKYDFICDGHALTDSCPGGSDERSCFCPRILCKGHCVPKGWSGCEGYPECMRKEDELLCLKNGSAEDNRPKDAGTEEGKSDPGRKVMLSSQQGRDGQRFLSDYPPSFSNTKVNLSIEEVINNSLSLLSTTDQNLLKSSGPSFVTTTLPPLYRFSSPTFNTNGRPQDNSATIYGDGGDRMTPSRTDFTSIRRRNGEEEDGHQQEDNVLTRPPYSSHDRRSPEASPVDSVINFFTSKPSSASSSIFPSFILSYFLVLSYSSILLTSLLLNPVHPV